MLEIQKIISCMPKFIKRGLAGKKITVDNQTLSLNSQLLLKNFYRMIDDKICNLTPKQAREKLDWMVNKFYNQKKINNLSIITNDIIIKKN